MITHKPPIVPDGYTECVLRSSAKASGCLVNEMLSKMRHKKIVVARQVFVAILRDTTRLSYPEITRIIRPCGAGHSTVIDQYRNAHRKIKAGDEDFLSVYVAARQMIKQEYEGMIA